MLGSELRAVPETVLPTVAFRVWSSALEAVTSTVSATEPTSSVTLRVSAVPTLTAWLVSLEMRNPCLFTETSYVPEGISTKRYLPFSLVEAVREIFVPLSVRVTDAAAIAAPDGSVIVPATVPVDELCERKAAGRNANKKSESPIMKSDRLLSI